MEVFKKTLHISLVKEQELSLLCDLFNRTAQNETPYQKIDAGLCRALFYPRGISGDDSVCDDLNTSLNGSSDSFMDGKPGVLTFLAWEDAKPVGFISGCIRPETAACYLTFILTAKEKRRQGIGTRLLQALMEEMRKKVLSLSVATEAPKLQISFFNPCALTWIVPGTPGHDHPNAPGVDVSSGAYLFFKNRNFLPVVCQNSFYLPLARYEQPSGIAQKRSGLLEQGIEICRYRPNQHTGLSSLTENLGNPVWKEELLANEALKEKGRPLAAAIYENKIIGFAGPLRVQESGRGYFAGIGVHSDYRGFGLGNVLFHTLCASLKEMGAGYMTLFTGENNPAGQIYLKAGFGIVKSWADMEIGL